MAGLSSMPAYDDGLLDHSADELDIELPRDSNNSSTRETPPPRIASSLPDNRNIQFVSTHFEESSSDEEFGLPEDVRIPNYDTYDKKGRARHSSGDVLSAALPPAAAQLLSNTVASVMQDAILTAGQLVQNPDNETEHTAARAPSVSHENIRRRKPQESKNKEDPQDDSPQLAPSDSSELVDQFEVLDQSELSSFENEPAESLNQSGSDGGRISRLSDYGMGLINSWWPGKK